MIYMLSESEIYLLMSVSGSECNKLSPFYGKSKTKILKHYHQNTIRTLKRISLVSEASEGDDYILTPEGKLLSEMLFQPDAAAVAEMRSDKDRLYHLCRKEDIWLICVYSSEFNAYIIRSFFTTHLLGKWLKENLCNGFDGGKNETQLDLHLTHDEWYIFLISQLYIVKAKPDDYSFTVDSLTEIHKQTMAERPAESVSDIKKLKNIILELAKKNVLTVKDGKLTYSKMAFEWLDNRLITDTLRFSYKKAGSLDYTVLFTIRQNGITALYNNENGVRLISSKNIPWVFYLQ